MNNTLHATTILAVRTEDTVSIGGDGQVTLGNAIIKGTACKVRKLYNDTIIAGFAGSTADAFTLFEKFEAKLQEHQGNLALAAVRLATEWRSDKALRRLEAMLLVADAQKIFTITGNGDVLEPENDVMAIGSGGNFALSAALALRQNTEMPAPELVKCALTIAAQICIYTNHSITINSIARK